MTDQPPEDRVCVPLPEAGLKALIRFSLREHGPDIIGSIRKAERLSTGGLKNTMAVWKDFVGVALNLPGTRDKAMDKVSGQRRSAASASASAGARTFASLSK